MSINRDIDYIRVVHAFRNELEQLKDLGKLPAHMQSFPSSCCGVVSEILGDYLNSQLELQVEYVCGEKDGGTHAWLELEGVLIDITSDQFEGRTRVYIGANDDWYSAWAVASRQPAIHHPSAVTYREEREVLRWVLNGAGLPDPDA